jgi:hypothetical protein
LKWYIRLNASGEKESTDKFELFRLMLSTRARNLVDRLGLRTIADLRRFGMENIRREQGCGKKTCGEIFREVERLEEFGPEKYIAASRAGGEGFEKPGINLDAGSALQILVNELGRSGYINSTQAQKLLGLDSFSVRPLLKLLVDKGHAVKEGRRRGMRYVRAV